MLLVMLRVFILLVIDLCLFEHNEEDPNNVDNKKLFCDYYGNTHKVNIGDWSDVHTHFHRVINDDCGLIAVS